MTKAEQLQIDMKDLRNWKRTCAKQYEVYICMPVPGTKTRNALENCTYITDQKRPFIISGTLGETWTIDANKFASKYGVRKPGGLAPVDIDKYNQAYLNGQTVDWRKFEARPGQGRAWAFFLDIDKYGNAAKNFPVQTSWGDTLIANRTGIQHGHGDFLVCEDVNGRPDLSNMWVVNGRVFVRTYNLQQFKNLGVVQDDFVTLRPMSIGQREQLGEASMTRVTNMQVANPENSREFFSDIVKRIDETKGHFGVDIVYSFGDGLDGFTGSKVGFITGVSGAVIGIVVSGQTARLVHPVELIQKVVNGGASNVKAKDYKINIVSQQQLNTFLNKIKAVVQRKSLSDKEYKYVSNCIDIWDTTCCQESVTSKYPAVCRVKEKCEFGIDWAYNEDDDEDQMKALQNNKASRTEQTWQWFQMLADKDSKDVDTLWVFNRRLPGFENDKVAFIEGTNEMILGVWIHDGKVNILNPLELAHKIESKGQSEFADHYESFSMDQGDNLYKYLSYCMDNRVIDEDTCMQAYAYIQIWQSSDAELRHELREQHNISNAVTYDDNFDVVWCKENAV